MRKNILVAITLVTLVCVTVFIVILVILNKRRPPTQFGWRAQVTTLAGDGSPSFRDAMKSAPSAFSDPFGIAVNDDGVIFIADAGDSNLIRKLTPDGSVTTVAGSVEGYADGPGTRAAFNTPSGLALDSEGNLFVADTDSSPTVQLYAG